MIEYISVYLPHKMIYVSGERAREYKPASDASINRLRRLAETYCDELTVRHYGSGFAIRRNVYYRVLGGNEYVQV